MEEIQSWWEVPTIAHFCSLFRAAFSLLDFDIEDLEEALLSNNDGEANPFLVDLLVRLLSGCYQRNDLDMDNYHKYLKDFIKHRWIKEKGKDTSLLNEPFQALSLRHKVELLHTLCDARLDAPDVAEVLKNLEADSLRVEPLGEDETGATYWYFYGTRLYKEIKSRLPTTKEKGRLRKKKGKDRKRKRDKRRRTKGRKAKDQKQESDSSSDENEEESSSRPSVNTNAWSVVCSTEEEWKEFAERFKKSKLRCERDLFRTLTVDFLPEIGNMIAEKEKQQKKKLLEIAPRRASQRISRLRQQREEEVSYSEDRIAGLTDTSDDSQQPREKEREKKSPEHKSREERFLDRQIAKEERARRAQMREERAQLIAEGKELPASLKGSTGSFLRKRRYDMFMESDEDIYIGMFKVFEAMKNHRDSWPFLQPVDGAFAPGYYDIVKQPMDLSTIDKKLQGKQYTSKDEFENDVMLMLDNCRKYNGIDSDYTRMSTAIQNVYDKAMKKFFPCDSSDDETFTPEAEMSEVEKEVEQPPKPMLLKHSGVKAMQMLAQVAEQALQNSSKRSAASELAKGLNAASMSEEVKKLRPLILGKRLNATPTGGQTRIICVQRKPSTATNLQSKVKTEGVAVRPAYSLNIVSKTSDGIMVKPVQAHELAAYRQAASAMAIKRENERRDATSTANASKKIVLGVVGATKSESGVLIGTSKQVPKANTAVNITSALNIAQSRMHEGTKNVVVLNSGHPTSTSSFVVIQNSGVAISATPALRNISTNALKGPVMYCQVPARTTTTTTPSALPKVTNSIPVKKRTAYLAVEDKMVALPNSNSSSVTVQTVSEDATSSNCIMNSSNPENAGAGSTVLHTSDNNCATAATQTNPSVIMQTTAAVEGLAEKLHLGGTHAQAVLNTVAEPVLTTVGNPLTSSQSGMMRTVMLAPANCTSKPTAVIMSTPKLDMKAQQKTATVVQATTKATIANLNTTPAKLATVPQASTAVQYAVSFGQNVKSSIPANVQPTSVVAIANDSYAPTQIQLAPTYGESAKISNQYHYVDPSTIQLATLSPANMVPLTLKAEPTQSPQLFYVQHQGQLVIQQPYQQNHNLQFVPSTVTGHPALTSSKTILLPAGSQPTFVTSQPATVAAHIPNGTMQYYSVIQHLT